MGMLVILDKVMIPILVSASIPDIELSSYIFCKVKARLTLVGVFQEGTTFTS
jgi:hypothetical protein